MPAQCIPIEGGNEGCGRHPVTGGLLRSIRTGTFLVSSLPVCVKPFVGLLQLEDMAGPGWDLDPNPRGKKPSLEEGTFKFTVAIAMPIAEPPPPSPKSVCAHPPPV